MARLPRSTSASAANPARVALEAVQAGDLRTAIEFFAKAVNADKRNAAHRYNFALCAEQVGEIGIAAREYSVALALNRTSHDAARRLAALLRNYDLADWGQLDETGLAAAFRAPQIDTQPLANAALQWLKAKTALGTLLKQGAETGYEAVARRIILPKPHPILGHELLTAALALGINKQPDIEHLLTALRRVLLLEAGSEALADRTTHAFAQCLAEHGLATGYIWASTPAEDEKAAEAIDLSAVGGGDLDAAHRLLLTALYRPLSQVCGGHLAAANCSGVRPRSFRDLLVQHLSEAEEIGQIAGTLPVLGTIADPISLRMAAHYGAHPYPRWTNVQPTPPGATQRALRRYFTEERLKFFDEPFDVLVAGCGTGHQAVDLALSLGEKGRVLGIDLSRPSLAYGQRIANQNTIKNVTLAQADVLELPKLDRRFEIIVCAGVLHHMADPFFGWRALTSVLKPGGLMMIALYSKLGRQDLAVLRTEPAYPGEDCSDAAARSWRQTLMGRTGDAPGRRLARSHDFYSLPEFRDLTLNPNEHHLTLPQIDSFLQDSGLIFRGFLANAESLADFAKEYPGEEWPGSLAHWSAFEEKHPTMFEGMYQFWCEKPL